MCEPRRLVKAEVNATDIKQGVRRSSCNCPLAHATRRALGDGFAMVDVVRHRVSAVQKATGDVWVALLPPEAVGFVVAFDHGQQMYPRSFELAFERVDC